MKDQFKKIIVYLLEEEAKLVLKKYKPKIVAITGTVGKTSTKDAVFTALSRFYYVRAPKKSFNSEVGIPLTILNLPNPTKTTSILSWTKNLLNGFILIIMPNHYPEWLILEVGADHPGDIKSITEWIKPDVVVITKLSKVPVHVEFFSTVEDIFIEKGYLVTALKRGGTLVLNADDEDVVAYKNLSEEKTILFGMGNGADIFAKEYEVLYDEQNLPTGFTFNVYSEGEVYPVLLKHTLGEHHMYQVLSALGVCKALGEHLSVGAKAFKHHEPTPGRMRLIEGIKNTIIIDDTYNSSPVAVVEALNTLKKLNKSKRRIAVLGDMLELGRFSVDEHKKIGVLVRDCADILVTVGVRSKYTAEAALDAGMDEANILQFDASREAGDYIQNILKEGDAILVKGSQGVRMERVVEEIMKCPEDKERLLVRQDKEWQLRG